MSEQSNGNAKKFDPAILFRVTSNAQAVWSILFPILAKGQAVTMEQLVTAWETVIKAKKLETSGNTQSAQARANEYRNWCVRTNTWKRSEDCPGYVLGSRFDNVTIKGKGKSKSKSKSNNESKANESKANESNESNESKANVNQ